MRILAVADLHDALPQYDCLVQAAQRYGLVIIAGIVGRHLVRSRSGRQGVTGSAAG